MDSPSSYQLPLFPPEKTCAKCGETKALDAFGRDKGRPDGLFPYCKRCRLKDPARHDERQAMRAAGRRRCPRCEGWLDPSCFGRNRWRKDGLALHCRACQLAFAQRYYWADPERAKRRNKRRYWAHAAKRLADFRQWYQGNRERVIARHLERSRTPEGKARQARANHKRRLRALHAPATLTAAEWAQILAEQDNCCLGCGLSFSHKLPATRDHVLPLSRGGALSAANTVALCKPCNSRKRDRLIDPREMAKHTRTTDYRPTELR